jgi:hypothetical protein
MESHKDVLLVECKNWSRRVKASEFLTLLARVVDTAGGSDAASRQVRGALVTSKGLQSGVDTLAEYYKRCMSTFRVSSDGEFRVESHTHFIEPGSILSAEAVGTPTIVQGPPPSS